MPSTLRVVGYVRISRDTDESSSIAKQTQVIEQTAAARGWSLVAVVQDVDVSASKTRLNRPGLNQARAMVAEGAADAIAVWRLDRIARNVIDLSTLLDEGIDVISCTEPLDTASPLGKAMAQIIQIFAELESSTIGVRVKSAISYRVSQGDRWRGSAPPYGYRIAPHPTGDGKTLVIDADEAAVLREVAHNVLAGASVFSQVKRLNAAGIRPRRAVEWNVTTLRVVLVGDSALGRQTRLGEPTRAADGTIDTPWPAVLTVDESTRLRTLLEPSPRQPRRKAGRLLSSGLVVCGTCEATLRLNTRMRKHGKVDAYACRANTTGANCTAPVSIDAIPLENHVVDTMLRLAGHLEVMEEIVTTSEPAELASVHEAIQATTDAMRAPGADIASLAARLTSLVERRDELAGSPSVPVVELVATGVTFLQRWAYADLVLQRQLLRSMMGGPVVVLPVGKGNRVPAAERAVVTMAHEADPAGDSLAGQV